jgi:hypothetical protein
MANTNFKPVLFLVFSLDYAKEKTKNNTGLKLVFAINYGGRAELVQSMKSTPDVRINKSGSGSGWVIKCLEIINSSISSLF